GATAHVLATGAFVSVPDTLRPFEAVPAAADGAGGEGAPDPGARDELRPSRFGTYEELAGRGVRAFAVAPLSVGGRVLGTLAVNFAPPGQLRGEDRGGLELFAAHAAGAPGAIRLAAERRTAQRELAAREAEATALRELDRLKNVFLSTISHELRTPLTVVHGHAQLLAERARALTPAAVEAQAGRILAASTQLT